MAEFEIKNFNVNNNICIEASAGTGKTFTVQQIVAELLRLKPARSLENILIVTYTDKATGELRERIRSKIQEVLIELKKNKAENSLKKIDEQKYLSYDEQIENFEKQMALVDNAPIYTIHSFCQKTLSEFGFEATQCDDMETLDESEAEAFVEKWLRDEMSKDDVYNQFMLGKSEDEKINLEAYVKALGKYYLNSDKLEEPDIVVLDKTIDSNFINETKRWTGDELTQIKENVRKSYGTYFNIKKIQTIKELAKKINDQNIKTKVSVSDNDNEAAFKEYEKNVKLLEQMVDDVNGPDGKSNGNTKKLAENVKKLSDGLNLVINSGYSSIESSYTLNFPTKASEYFKAKTQSLTDYEDLCNYFVELKNSADTVAKNVSSNIKKLKTLIFEEQIPELYKAWVKYKAENKKQDFDDMIRNVREAVCKENSELLKKLKEKYFYAIIDEFQDTNQKQWDIFKRVFMNYDANTKNCSKDNGRSICVVGDPKQSIYSFQGADVNVYTSALEDIKNSNEPAVQAELPYTLERNFRSTNLMIDACNALFENNNDSNFFGENSFTFSDSHHPDYNNPDNAKLVKPNAEFDGNVIQPFWVPAIIDNNGEIKSSGLDENAFAEFAAKQIIECCSFVDSGKTRLQIYRKNKKDADGNFVLTNVSFSDFAVLCKSKSEMEPLKHIFAECGIPYNHYKEANLFNGRECLDWIALFKAISAEDFTSSNRKILNECLYSSFFGKPLDEIESPKFDLPDCPERQLILQWKKIAEERKWALLQESIFEKSNVEERLSRLDKLSSLTKLRQLGDYCVEYLYKNNCSVEELVHHLCLIVKNISEVEEDDGNLVGKGTDFNAVQIMTVHASKGLEFPVVIAAAGTKGPSNKGDGSYSYHDTNLKLHINYDETFKVNNETVMNIASKEKDLEWDRIFYVAYTRASSLMIMPWHARGFDFLNIAFEKSAANDDRFLNKILFNDDFDLNSAKSQVQNILAQTFVYDLEKETEDSWKVKLIEFSSKVKNLGAHKLSYTNLSHGKKSEHYVNVNNPEINKNGENSQDDNSAFDKLGISFTCNYEKDNLTKIKDNYPRGNLLGEAVHETFEMAEFYRIGNLSEAEAESDKKLEMLIRTKFKGQGINIDENDSKGILNQTCKIVWNTLNAKLPEISGNSITQKKFSLKELKDNEHSAEMEFNMNPLIPHNAEALKDYFNGFIDLLFVRKTDDGKEIYSVLDWKTDSMDAADYANEISLKIKTDKDYSIQRVLYSYCLIKWLKQFNPELSEQEIFEQKFGGIYYVFVRGTKAETENGIYAHSWNSWADLKASFDKIIKEKLPEEK